MCIGLLLMSALAPAADVVAVVSVNDIIVRWQLWSLSPLVLLACCSLSCSPDGNLCCYCFCYYSAHTHTYACIYVCIGKGKSEEWKLGATFGYKSSRRCSSVHEFNWLTNTCLTLALISAAGPHPGPKHGPLQGPGAGAGAEIETGPGAGLTHSLLIEAEVGVALIFFSSSFVSHFFKGYCFK